MTKLDAKPEETPRYTLNIEPFNDKLSLVRASFPDRVATPENIFRAWNEFLHMYNGPKVVSITDFTGVNLEGNFAAFANTRSVLRELIASGKLDKEFCVVTGKTGRVRSIVHALIGVAAKLDHYVIKYFETSAEAEEYLRNREP